MENMNLEKHYEIEKMLDENVIGKATALIEFVFESGEYTKDFIINGYDRENNDYKYITDWYVVSAWFAYALETVGAPVFYYEGSSYWGLVGSGVALAQRWEVIDIYDKHYKKDMNIYDFIKENLTDNVTELANLCFKSGWFNKDYLHNVDDINAIDEWYLMSFEFHCLIDGDGVPAYEDFERDIHLWGKCNKGNLCEDPIVKKAYETYKKGR